MDEKTKFSVVNIREYLDSHGDIEIGERALAQLLSDYSCPLNVDVEQFLKNQAVEFTKKNQSVTYLVFSDEDASLLGYFTLTVKSIIVDVGVFSNSVKRKISRVSEQTGEGNTYQLAAYLIAQIGKNYTNGLNRRISGEELMGLAINQIRYLQYQLGGMVVFLEAEPKEALMEFYQKKNGFLPFDTRETSNRQKESHTLIQMLKTL